MQGRQRCQEHMDKLLLSFTCGYPPDLATFLYLWCGYPSDLAKDDASKGIDICIVDEMLWSLLLPDSLGRVISCYIFLEISW